MTREISWKNLTDRAMLKLVRSPDLMPNLNRKTKMTAIEIRIEEYVAPAKEPHKYAPTISALIEAGPDKVATVEFPSEDEANTFVREMQAAAREQNKSGIKRAFVKTDTGYRVSMAVRDKITRNRKTPDDVRVETPAPAKNEKTKNANK